MFPLSVDGQVLLDSSGGVAREQLLVALGTELARIEAVSVASQNPDSLRFRSPFKWIYFSFDRLPLGLGSVTVSSNGSAVDFHYSLLAQATYGALLFGVVFAPGYRPNPAVAGVFFTAAWVASLMMARFWTRTRMIELIQNAAKQASDIAA